jgi:hypothetical protein
MELAEKPHVLYVTVDSTNGQAEYYWMGSHPILDEPVLYLGESNG